MMKNLTILIFILFSTLSLAEVKKSAVVRDKKFRPRIEKVVLQNLISENSYEGKFFKIVVGKENEAISFKSDAELQLKAATTYYHLNKARKFFVENVKSEYVSNFKQIIIRLEHKNKFSELGHFAHDNLEPQFNNALTIPAGVGLPSRGISPWASEIWFRPVKKIHVDELGAATDGASFRGALAGFRKRLSMMTLQRFLTQMFLGTLVPEGGNAVESIMRTAGASIVLEAIYQNSKFLESILSRKWYKLDSALVPEIIYHEFAHLALSDKLVLSHSTPVNEGLADYFAGVIANSPKLATKIKKYNTFSGKNAKNKTRYRSQFENGDFANTDFVFGLLWEVRNILGKELANNFLYKLRNSIETNSNIRDQLLEAILAECKVSCKSPNVDRLKLLKLFNSKGI